MKIIEKGNANRTLIHFEQRGSLGLSLILGRGGDAGLFDPGF